MDFSDYVVFIDESGDHSLVSIDAVYPIFVLCFCIIKKDIYLSEVIPKIKDLKLRTFGHDFIIFHENDIRKKKGAFSQLGKETREQFLDELTHLIESLDFSVIAIVIDKIAHKKKYNQPIHPYHLALQFGLERVFSFLPTNDRAKLTHLIFEARGKNEDDELELAFRRVCAGNNRSKREYPFQMVIADKKTNSEGLQIADLFARPIGLSVIKADQKNLAYEIIEKKFWTSNTGIILGNGKKVFPL